MSKGELVDMLVSNAKQYLLQECGNAVVADPRATLTDFLNFVAWNQSIDLGLVAKDLE